MKKFLLILPCAAALFLISCNSESKTSSGTSETAKKNLDAFHTVSDAFKTGDVSKIDSVVASDFVDHTERGDMGRDSLKAMITMMHQKGSDMTTEIIKEFADDEYVMGWLRYKGTSDGSMGPAGPYNMQAIEVVRFKDGKAVEHWAFMEASEMMKMMGAGQPHMDDKKPGGDTTNK
jgi:predicted SnoaL-like aldol condensation-catalyzing enzyme